MVISTVKTTLEVSNGLNRINSVTKAKCFSLLSIHFSLFMALDHYHLRETDGIYKFVLSPTNHLLTLHIFLSLALCTQNTSDKSDIQAEYDVKSFGILRLKIRLFFS